MVTTIGIDPHKATHTAVAVDDHEAVVSELLVRADRDQVPNLVQWADRLDGGKRIWAIESAGGLGYLLSQQLLAVGETVIDVPAVLASRVRVLGSGKSDKSDPNDARSVAIAAFRQPGLVPVRRENHQQVLRMLAKRHLELTSLRTQAICRLHAVLATLRPGGMPSLRSRLSVQQAARLLSGMRGITPTEQQRKLIARQHLADVRRLDKEIAANKQRIKAAVVASGTTLVDIRGVGPIVAAFVIGYTGDPSRFQTADRYAAYNGTAPIEVSSGGKTRHRLSLRGNRKLNHAIHMAAVTQIRFPTEGRVYYDKKLAEGKTKKEALRSLKRRISDAVYRQLLADQQTITR
jgi:transposase